MKGQSAEIEESPDKFLQLHTIKTKPKLLYFQKK